jgi:hypothetical protein
MNALLLYYLLVYIMICVVNKDAGAFTVLICFEFLTEYFFSSVIIRFWLLLFLVFISTEFLNTYGILDLVGQNYVHIELYDSVEQR